jgi:hypothetical protein
LESDDVLLNFFKEHTVSKRNQEIVLNYIADLRDIGKGLSEFTIANNTRIMMFVLKNLFTDLDKLTKDDIRKYNAALETYRRKDGKFLSKEKKIGDKSESLNTKCIYSLPMDTLVD